MNNFKTIVDAMLFEKSVSVTLDLITAPYSADLEVLILNCCIYLWSTEYSITVTYFSNKIIAISGVTFLYLLVSCA